MATTVRDRTARSRIRNYLAEHGPIVDPSGRATAVLKDAIGYEGSPVAFIQLVTAMDKGREIERQIRGKRTYQISGPESDARAITLSRAQTSATPAVTCPVTGTTIEVDYDELARALLRETWRLAGSPTSSAGGASELEATRQERDQLVAERDEYARRLQQLSAMINGLAPSAARAAGAGADGAGADSTDSQSRRPLAELPHEQGENRREQAG